MCPAPVAPLVVGGLWPAVSSGALRRTGDGGINFEEFEQWFMGQGQEAQERLYVVYYKAADGQQAETTMDQLPQLLAGGSITEQTIIWMDGCGWSTPGLCLLISGLRPGNVAGCEW